MKRGLQKGESMKTVFQKWMAGLGLIVVGAILTTTATAQCGSFDLSKSGSLLHKQSWTNHAAHGLFQQASQSDDAIVGLWKVNFIAVGNEGIPDGVVIDKALAQWHADGTEIMNSSRPPITSSFCLGVWKKTAPFQYTLNHFALGWDTSSNFVGPVNIRESVVLSHDGKSFVGAFTIDQYDPSGNPLAHVSGHLAGSRIEVNTGVSGVL
jgi:hypothetical protein